MVAIPGFVAAQRFQLAGEPLAGSLEHRYLALYEIWAGDFDYLCQKLGGGVFTLTMHPQVIGRGHRMLMLERLIEHMRAQTSVRFGTMGEYAGEWRARNPLAAQS